MNSLILAVALLQFASPVIVYSLPEGQCPTCERLFAEIGYGTPQVAVAYQHGNYPEWVKEFPSYENMRTGIRGSGLKSRSEFMLWAATEKQTPRVQIAAPPVSNPQRNRGCIMTPQGMQCFSGARAVQPAKRRSLLFRRRS